MDAITKIRRLVRCSACQGRIRGRVNLVDLERVATCEYPTAGNVLTGEHHHAVAICCDRCIDDGVPYVEAVEMNGTTVVYHAIGSLEPIG
jgi:hypothetical protein